MLSSRYPGEASGSTRTSTVSVCASLETTLLRVPGPKLTGPLSAEPNTTTRVVEPTRAAVGTTAASWASLARTATQSAPISACSASNHRPAIFCPSSETAYTSRISRPDKVPEPRHSNPVYTMTLESPVRCCPVDVSSVYATVYSSSPDLET